MGGVARALLVTSYDGRPVKVEGNPSDPIGRGASSVLDQASVLDLYDPDRSRALVRREGRQEMNPSWDDFLTWAEEHFGRLRDDGGRGLYVLSEPTGSLAVAALREALENGANATDALEQATAAAEKGMKDTIPMLAKKGRASYLGERSIGHQDPGATSSYLLIRTMAEIARGKE